ncbi:unnamed protein product, partial [Laminaria digitata]
DGSGGGSGGGGGGSSGGDNGDEVVMLVVGRPPSEDVRSMAVGRLSKWALKFAGQRTYAPPAVPTIEPINDDYLTSFGRSYADVKSLAQEKKEKEKDKKMARRVAKRAQRIEQQKGEG